MKKIALSIFLISLLFSPTFSQENAKFFFKNNKNTTNFKRNNPSSNKSTNLLIGTAITLTSMIGITGIVFLTDNKNTISDDSSENSFDFDDNTKLCPHNSSLKTNRFSIQKSQEVKEKCSEIEEQIADFYTQLIWDEDKDYKVREQFVYFLLYTFGFIHWDQTCYVNFSNPTTSTLNKFRSTIFPNKFDFGTSVQGIICSK